MKYQNKSISEELAIFMFNYEKFQRAIEYEQIKMEEEEITKIFKSLSRSGGLIVDPFANNNSFAQSDK